MRAPLSLLLLALPLVAASCGGGTVSGSSSPDGGGAGAEAGGGPDGGESSEASAVDGGGDDSGAGEGGAIEGGAGDGGACSIPAPQSAFTFHVHNGGTRDLGLGYGCGQGQPIVLVTPAGSLGIGAESANSCGFTCEQDYQGKIQQGCSDCGPGVGAALPVGNTVDITWDRRVYVTHTADPLCVGGQTGVSCALAVAVAPTAAQQGTITLCTGGASSGGPGSGNCGGDDPVMFTVDTTHSAATIEVK